MFRVGIKRGIRIMGLKDLIAYAERVKASVDSYEGRFLEEYNKALQKYEQQTSLKCSPH